MSALRKPQPAKAAAVPFPTKAPKPPRKFTIAWAAAELGYSVPTVRKLIAAGKLRAYGTGHQTRVSEQAVRDCIAQLEQERRPS
jgi:excisionase family DNA binding protein